MYALEDILHGHMMFLQPIVFNAHLGIFFSFSEISCNFICTNFQLYSWNKLQFFRTWWKYYVYKCKFSTATNVISFIEEAFGQREKATNNSCSLVFACHFAAWSAKNFWRSYRSACVYRWNRFSFQCCNYKKIVGI